MIAQAVELKIAGLLVFTGKPQPESGRGSDPLLYIHRQFCFRASWEKKYL
jgi:hypothetical protein